MNLQGDSWRRRRTAIAVLLVIGTATAVLPDPFRAPSAQAASLLRYEVAYTLRGPGLYTVFGNALATRGRRLYVGAPSPLGGDSYLALFDLATGAPRGRLEGAWDSALGTALAVSPRSIAVSAPGIDDEPGKVLVLDRRARSRRTIGAPEGSWAFGRALAWQGRRLFASDWRREESAPWPDEYRVVVELDERRGEVVRTIASPRANLRTGFGHALAAVRGGLAIASPGDGFTGDTEPGQVHLYDRAGRLVRTLERPLPARGDHFGASIASARNRLLVGAPSHWLAGDGAAYLYQWREGTWVLERTFASPEGSHFFGGAVAIDGKRALISGDEKAHLFDLATGDLLATLTPPPSPDPEEPPPYPRGAFGHPLAIAGKTLLVAAPRQDENEEGHVFAFVPAD